MQHRIFIAINLPEKIRRELSEYRGKWPELPCRWTKQDNLHITLAFLGYLADDELPDILRITKEIASKNKSFFITLNKIIYGPPKKNPPRMIWVEGESNKELGKLQKELENAFRGFPGDSKKETDRDYSPHITLGRLKEWEFRKMDQEERPEVNEEISFNFGVNSIEVMESDLKRTGPEYAVLESMPFPQL